jgi:hypothetical protein
MTTVMLTATRQDIDMPTDTSATDFPDSAKWAWLEGTYWYVPEAYMLAKKLLINHKGEQRIIPVKDQTLWQIQRYEHGYITGRGALCFDGQPFNYQTIIGSVSPEGDVLVSFTPENVDASTTPDPSKKPAPSDPSTTVSTGPGRMTLIQGKWVFMMQMTNGSDTSSMTHWAYMVQSTPADPSWNNIPGVPGVSIGEVFAAVEK